MNRKTKKAFLPATRFEMKLPAMTAFKKKTNPLKPSVPTALLPEPEGAPASHPVPAPAHVKLYDAIKATYGDKKSIANVEQQGYVLDKELTNGNQTVFWNPREEKLLFGVAGTHNANDAFTDLMLATGNLKRTGRYHEAKDVFKKAKEKYNPKESKGYGHSLGAPLVRDVGADSITTFNGASEGGLHATAKNETAYRTPWDLVSAPAVLSSKTFSGLGDFSKINPLEAHSSNILKNKEIFI